MYKRRNLKEKVCTCLQQPINVLKTAGQNRCVTFPPVCTFLLLKKQLRYEAICFTTFFFLFFFSIRAIPRRNSKISLLTCYFSEKFIFNHAKASIMLHEVNRIRGIPQISGPCQSPFPPSESIQLMPLPSGDQNVFSYPVYSIHAYSLCLLVIINCIAAGYFPDRLSNDVINCQNLNYFNKKHIYIKAIYSKVE